MSCHDSIEITEFHIPSGGGGNLHCMEWLPHEPIRAVVQIVHGIAEHIKRYDEFARFLCNHGIAVVAEDHMGHGGSLGTGDPKGYFRGGWLTAVEDTYSLLIKTKNEFPQIPYIIFGHSMGSFLTRTLLYRHPDSGLAAAVICGTGWQPKALLSSGCALSGAICKIKGETAVSPLLHKIMFSGYLKKIKDPLTPFDWICSDSQVIRTYEADPLCGFTETCGLARDMLGGIRMNQDPEHLKQMNPDLPILFISGSLDPVGNYGDGVTQSAEAFRNAGMKDVTQILYNKSRHEILNDVEKLQVFNQVLQWIISKIF